MLLQLKCILPLIQIFCLWHTISQPETLLCPQGGLSPKQAAAQLPPKWGLVQSPPLAQCCSLVRLHEAPAAVQRLSSHHHQAWWPWGFLMVKGQYGDTHLSWGDGQTGTTLLCRRTSVHLHSLGLQILCRGEEKTVRGRKDCFCCSDTTWLCALYVHFDLLSYSHFFRVL